MRWTYFIDSIEVFPMNTRELKIKDTLENDTLYAYRKALNGTIDLRNGTTNDYDYIKTIEATGKHTKHTLEIFDNSVLHLTCEFTVYDIEFDDYIKTCSIKVTPRDEYTPIQENEDIEVNVIGDRTNVTLELYSYWHFYCVRNVEVDQEYGKVLLKGISFGFGQYISLFVTELLRLHKDTAIPSGFVLYADLGDYKVYQRFPVDWDLNYTSTDSFDDVDISDYRWSGRLFYRPPIDESTHNYFKLAGSVPGYDLNFWELWVKKSAYNHRANMVVVKDYPAIPLRIVANKILTDIGFSGTFKSSLLFNDPPETGKSIPASYPVETNSLYVIDINDFKRPDALQESQKAILTFKRFIEYFCGKDKAKWFIDSDGCIRVEIEPYLKPTDALDISADPSLHRKYDYDSNDKPNREYLAESQAFNEDFGQIETLYGTVPALNGVKENTKTISLSTFYTDVDGLNQHLDELPDDGFVLVEVSAGAVVKGTGFKSWDTGLQNVNLSNANVLNAYHRYNAYQPDYYIGGKPVSAISLKWLKKQDLTFQSVPDKNKLLVTLIGEGLLKSMEYQLTEENNFKTEVSYE